MGDPLQAQASATSRKRFPGCLQGLCLLVALLALAGAARAADPVVILLSWDGVRYDYLEKGEFPALARVQKEGARAEKLVTVFPSLTFPSHVTLATGANVEHHGIVANSFRDRVRGKFQYENDASWLEAEPIWVAAERQGVHSAVFFWVGSETDWRGVGASYRKAPFDSHVSEEAKVQQILAWLDLPAPQRPRLVLSWWHGADAAGHRYGPDSPKIPEALAEQDHALAQLLAGLDARAVWSYATLVIVSDHGMAAVHEPVDLLAPLKAKGIEAELIPSNGLAHLWLTEPSRLGEALSALGALPGVTVWAGDAVPKTLHYAFPGRMGDVVAVTTPPRFFVAPHTLQGVTGGMDHGAHGFDPELPEMGGIFLAMGRGVPHGARLPAVHAIDVAPTVARILGIDAPRNSEGAPIPGLANEVSARAPAAPPEVP
ncbi:MAG TPA: ectonucleotide pyrophosphatase/phosphodiesterase [Myxococcota bacterium]|nr:ectonucleotide pyrophosphatase/phosphodiesterase [Myxococcota bacterium]